MRATYSTDAVQIDSWLTGEDEPSLANDVDGLTKPSTCAGGVSARRLPGRDDRQPPPRTRPGVLAKIATLVGPDDRLLLGSDLVKAPASRAPVRVCGQ